MKFVKHLSVVFSVFFLFVLMAPANVLLNSDKKTSSVVMSLEEETDKKDIEDIKEFAELDFDKIQTLNTCLFRSHQTLSFVFHSKTPIETPLKNTSPPPDYI
jgi:hypothetical protein